MYGTIKLLELKICMIPLQCCVLLVYCNSVGLIYSRDKEHTGILLVPDSAC